MFNNCICEFVCEQSCSDHHCVRGCDHGADVAGRNHDCSCLLTVSVTDDVDCLKRDGEAHRRHLRRGSPQLGADVFIAVLQCAIYCQFTIL